MFIMVLFVTGATGASDRTVFFNTSSADAVSTSASTTAFDRVTNAASISTSSSNPSPTTTALASGLPSASSTSSDSFSALHSSAKIGLGVGIPAAAIIGVGPGWLASLRGKAQGKQQSPGGPPKENSPMDLAGYSADTPKPSSRVVTRIGLLRMHLHMCFIRMHLRTCI